MSPSLSRWFFLLISSSMASSLQESTCTVTIASSDQHSNCTVADQGPWVRLGAASLTVPAQIKASNFPFNHKSWMPDSLKAPAADLPAVFEYEGNNTLDEDLRDLLNARLQQHGALLLKGLPIKTPMDFAKVTQSTNWTFLDYVGGVTKRPVVAPKVMPASAESPDACMEYHNDGSFGARPPTVLFLYCQEPPRKRGQALLYDARKILKTLKDQHPDMLDELRRRKVRYNQFFPDEAKLEGPTLCGTLQSAFAPTCGGAANFTQAVEEYLAKGNYGFEWTPSGLKTWYIRSPIAQHPVHNEEIWFNQLGAMHCSVFDNHPEYPELNRRWEDRAEPCKMRGLMPFHTTYGDGEEFPEVVLDTVRQVQWANAVTFDLQADTVLVIDNYLVGHGRVSFEPPRELFISQALMGSEVSTSHL